MPVMLLDCWLWMFAKLHVMHNWKRGPPTCFVYRDAPVVPLGATGCAAVAACWASACCGAALGVS